MKKSKSAKGDYGTKDCKCPVNLRTSEPQREMPPTPSKLIPQRKQLAGMS